jgi:hypothetical protein
MKIRIGIPNNAIFSKLYINSDLIKEKYNLEIIILPEQEILKLFKARRLDIALLTPLGYGSGVKIADYRIIDGPCLASIGFTGYASILMKSGIKNIQKLNSNSADDFMMIIGRILLAERYDINLKLESQKLENSLLFADSDVSIIWGNETEAPIKFDISEDWYDTYSFPLPLAVWCTYGDDPIDNCKSIIHDLADASLKEFEDIKLIDSYGEEKSCELIWKWNDDFKNAIDEMVQLLFFHQYISEVPKIKLINSD